MWNRLFGKILDSSIWLESEATRLVWITFLAAMDKDGIVRLSTPGNVAARARVAEADAIEALRILSSPDKRAPEQTNGGKRIERIEDGWRVINADKYRQIGSHEVAKAKTRDRVARWRERNAGVTATKRSVTTEESESESESEPEASEGISDIGARSRVPAVATPDTAETIPDSEPEPEAGKAKKKPRATRLPDGWVPDDAATEYAAGLALDPQRVAEDFRDYWTSLAGVRALKLDWAATWRTWCRREADRQARQPGGNGRQPVVFLSAEERRMKRFADKRAELAARLAAKGETL